MQKKKIIILILPLILVAIIIGLIINNNNNKLEEGYILVFHGEKTKKEYKTYIYNISNDQNNNKFKYVNVINKKGKIKVTKKGTIDSIEEIFKVAKKNNAYSYVTQMNNDERYLIEDFKRLLLNEEGRKKNGKK